MNNIRLLKINNYFGKTIELKVWCYLRKKYDYIHNH